MRVTVGRLVLGVVVVASMLTVGSERAVASAASVYSPVQGGGSGFAALEMDQWRADVTRLPHPLQVDYVAQGSLFGLTQFAAGAFDYAASELAFPASMTATLAAGRCRGVSLRECFAYVPVSAGGIGFMYNLIDAHGVRITGLRLSRDAACKIFTGQITSWSDPELVADNPALAGLAEPITPVVRYDSAGESLGLSQFCIAVAPTVWSRFVQAQRGSQFDRPEFLAGQPTESWPPLWGNAVPISTADGVANYVADPIAGRGAIGYVAAGYAIVRSFPVGQVQNASGAFVSPSSTSVTRGLATAHLDADGFAHVDFHDRNPGVYQPSMLSYMVVPTGHLDPREGDTLRAFLCYAVTTGQGVAAQLRYTPISEQLRSIAIAAIGRIPNLTDADDCGATSGQGYWLVTSSGTVYPFGNARSYGNAPSTSITHMSATPSGRGYWLVDAAGHVYAFGAAHWLGNANYVPAGEVISSISSTPTGNGYWLFSSKGRVFALGDARAYGDLSRTTLNGPIVASAVTPSGLGYYIVGSDGGVFCFGDAQFRGSTGHLRLNKPVVGITPTPNNHGYWLVASDGGVFAFNAPFRGSMGATHLNKPVNGLVAFGNGYLMIGSDGGTFDFSNRPFLGSLANNPPATPITGVAAFSTS